MVQKAANTTGYVLSVEWNVSQVQMPTAVRVPNVIDCAACPLRSLRTFCNLTSPALENFISIGVNKIAPRGTVLFRECSACDEIFVLCTGQAKLTCTSKAGKSVILKIARAGDVLGLGAMIAGVVHEATAETTESAQVKKIRKTELTAFLKLHGEASLHASHTLSLENNRAFLDIRRLTLSGSAAGKLAAVLLDWGRGNSCCETGMRFPMTLTHEELAAMTGVSRETVTRTLRRFQDEQLIQIAGYSIRILSPVGLESLSS